VVEPEDPAAQAAVAGEDDDAVHRATVRTALAGLTAPERELIALKFHAGLSNAEIGRVLGVSETNAGTRVHRAVTRLRKACHAPS
jgi:RNA polymerase sigma factor (sigma-70 family)